MNVKRIAKKLAATGLLALTCLLVSAPARAGIPVIDAANLVQQIQQVISWAQQYQQMMNSITQLQQQYQQLQTMTGKLDGARSLGTILNNPAIQAQLPPEMQNAAMMLANPNALSTNMANIGSTLAAFGVSTTVDPNAGKTAADGYGRAQAIMASSQQRQTQLQALASRVDSAADAKESLDLLNRNTLETANINNQMVQTMAALEAARNAESLRNTARHQQLANDIKTGGATPRIIYSY